MRTHKLSIDSEKRVATIECYENGELYATYRTNELTEQELEEMDYYTENDIRDYLRSSGDYYVVK